MCVSVCMCVDPSLHYPDTFPLQTCTTSGGIYASYARVDLWAAASLPRSRLRIDLGGRYLVHTVVVVTPSGKILSRLLTSHCGPVTKRFDGSDWSMMTSSLLSRE